MNKKGQGESPHLDWAKAHAEELKQYKGLWIAVNANDGVIASGQSILTVTQEAEARGYKGRASVIFADGAGKDREAQIVEEFMVTTEAMLVNRILAIALKDAELRDVNSSPDFDEVWGLVKKKPLINFMEKMREKIAGMKFSKEDEPWAYFSLGKIHGQMVMRAQKEGATLEEILGNN